MLFIGDTATEGEATQSIVLITGAAGFIGFHMARKLSDIKPHYQLVGLDNLDPYYDVNLKLHRVELLKHHGITFHEGDVCDKRLLKHLFDKYHITMVIHFAAQAGVRHSINDPLAYIRSNIECFVILLEHLWHYKVCCVHVCAYACPHYYYYITECNFIVCIIIQCLWQRFSITIFCQSHHWLPW